MLQWGTADSDFKDPPTLGTPLVINVDVCQVVTSSFFLSCSFSLNFSSYFCIQYPLSCTCSQFSLKLPEDKAWLPLTHHGYEGTMLA